MTNPSNELIFDLPRFSILKEGCETIIRTQNRLPEFVFQRPFKKYFAIEYGHIYRKEFGAFLAEIAVICEDEFVNYMMLDPDPFDHYQRHSVFGALSFSPVNIEERYHPLMSGDKNVAPLAAVFRDIANIGVFWGSSLKWGMMCDRLSWETIVIAAPENVDVGAMTDFKCLSAETLSSYIKSLYHWKPEAAVDFIERFFANYSI